jgi:hypothetical protein
MYLIDSSLGKVQDRDIWLAVVSAVMNLRDYKKYGVSF